jgi:predicted DCC family thiol-disulfide oxidoreductase YuxK
VNTEITDKEKLNGWVLYDGDCRLCLGVARRFQNLLAGRHFGLLPLQTPWVKARLSLPDSQLLCEMRLLRPDGNFFGGVDALLEIARYFWWAWPLQQIGRIPAMTKILHAVYRWIARNRNCTSHVCSFPSQVWGARSIPKPIQPPGLSNHLAIILPLPAGEGRGEGEQFEYYSCRFIEGKGGAR